MSRQEELDANPKAIQQIEFIGQLKNAADAIDDDESVCFNNDFGKYQRNKTKIFSRKINSL